MKTIKQALREGVEKLSPHEEAQFDAEILLAHVLGKSRVFLYAHSDDYLQKETEARFFADIHERKIGHPIAYLIGKKEFWSLELSVNPFTLIPRPETELLVEKTLELAAADSCHLLELGTGSGAIVIALAHQRKNWTFLATDISSQALDTAQKNAKKFMLNQIHFLQSDWFSNIPRQHFDVIVSNPPYIEDNDQHLEEGDLRFEPYHALASGTDGLDALRTIIQNASHFLKPQGLLVLEHGYQQADKVRTLLEGQQFQNINCHLDFQGHPRITSAYTHR
jgi:release factor glutamine methyltransferase